LRKPESAAQPGKVKPVLVAPSFQSAEGRENLKRASLVLTESLRVIGGKFHPKAFGRLGNRGGTGRVERSSGAKGHERRVVFFTRSNSRTGRKHLKVHPEKEKHEEGVLNQ
jgi:hypothetical protein